MKTIILAIVTLVCYSIVNNVHAQFNLGAGVSYGTDIEKAGLDLRAGYLMGDRFNLRADANIFGNRVSGATDTRWSGYNLNGSYWVRAGERLVIYPMAGLNATTVRTETTTNEPDGVFVSTDRETELGVNLGGGIGYQFNGLMPFAEGKYVTGDFNQGVYTIGLLYLFNQ